MLVAIMLGNNGFWLFCFNRANSTGLPRKVTKRCEKFFIGVCFAIPLGIATLEWTPLTQWLLGGATDASQANLIAGFLPSDAPVFRVWAIASLASLLALGPGWLASRLWLIPPVHLGPQACEHFDIGATIPGGSADTSFTKFLEALPGNEIAQLDVTRKELTLPRAVAAADGLRIAHISDLHFTGQLKLDHYRFVFERLRELDADLIVVTGDIIDYARCLPFVAELFADLTCPLGCFYLLGNHDCRLGDVRQVTELLDGHGHVDLGRQSRSFVANAGTWGASAGRRPELSGRGGGLLRIEMMGNELPWLRRHASKNSLPTWCEDSLLERDPVLLNKSDNTLYLALSHSPDQIPWARAAGADLLLAGHTHGGQVRLPGVGPLVSPSRYGSRFASGVFYLEPTLMHVSRGVAGTHPLRWRCRPEISLLTLRCPS